MKRSLLVVVAVALVAVLFPAGAFAVVTDDGRTILVPTGAEHPGGFYVQPHWSSFFSSSLQFRDAPSVDRIWVGWENRYTSPYDDSIAAAFAPQSVAASLHAGALEPATGGGYVFAAQSWSVYDWSALPADPPFGFLHYGAKIEASLSHYDSAQVVRSSYRDQYLSLPDTTASNSVQAPIYIKVAPGSDPRPESQVEVGLIGIAKRRADGLYDLRLATAVSGVGQVNASILSRSSRSGLSWAEVRSYGAALSTPSQYGRPNDGSSTYPADVFYGSQFAFGHARLSSSEVASLTADLDALTAADVASHTAGLDAQDFAGFPAAPPYSPDAIQDSFSDSPFASFLPDWAQAAVSWLVEKLNGLLAPLIERFLWWFPLFQDSMGVIA